MCSGQPKPIKAVTFPYLIYNLSHLFVPVPCVPNSNIKYSSSSIIIFNINSNNATRQTCLPPPISSSEAA